VDGEKGCEDFVVLTSASVTDSCDKHPNNN